MSYVRCMPIFAFANVIVSFALSLLFVSVFVGLSDHAFLFLAGDSFVNFVYPYFFWRETATELFKQFTVTLTPLWNRKQVRYIHCLLSTSSVLPVSCIFLFCHIQFSNSLCPLTSLPVLLYNIFLYDMNYREVIKYKIPFLNRSCRHTNTSLPLWYKTVTWYKTLLWYEVL